MSLIYLCRIPVSGYYVPIILITQFTLSGHSTIFYFLHRTSHFVIFIWSLIFVYCLDNVIFMRVHILSFLLNMIDTCIAFIHLSIHPSIHTYIYLKNINYLSGSLW